MSHASQQLESIVPQVGPIFFITPDPLHAVGLEQIFANLHVVCTDDSPAIQKLEERGASVFCVSQESSKEEQVPRTARHILSHNAVKKHIAETAGEETAHLLFFKLNFRVEEVLKDSAFDYTVLNPSVHFNRQFENKTFFLPWAKGKGIDLVDDYSIRKLASLSYSELSSMYDAGVVLQTPVGHGGSSTFFVKNQEDFESLQSTFVQQTDLEVVIRPYHEGRTVTVNACVREDDVLVSAPFLQVTGLEAYTPYPGGSCGNVWSKTLLDPEISLKIKTSAEFVGTHMAQEGFRGFFGLDFVVFEDGRVVLIENNARLTASVSMFTQLEVRENRIPLLAHHILTLSETNTDFVNGENRLEGAQLIVRNSETSSVVTGEAVPVGIYSLDANDAYVLTKPGVVHLEELGSEEVLVVGVGSSQKVSKGLEWMRVQALEAQLIYTGENVSSRIQDLVKRVSREVFSK